MQRRTSSAAFILTIEEHTFEEIRHIVETTKIIFINYIYAINKKGLSHSFLIDPFIAEDAMHLLNLVCLPWSSNNKQLHTAAAIPAVIPVAVEEENDFFDDDDDDLYNFNPDLAIHERNIELLNKKELMEHVAVPLSTSYQNIETTLLWMIKTNVSASKQTLCLIRS